jgi:hypothetical protein
MTTPERELEEQCIERLRSLKYEYRPEIRDRAALERKYCSPESERAGSRKRTGIRSSKGSGSTMGATSFGYRTAIRESSSWIF